MNNFRHSAEHTAHPNGYGQEYEWDQSRGQYVRHIHPHQNQLRTRQGMQPPVRAPPQNHRYHPYNAAADQHGNTYYNSGNHHSERTEYYPREREEEVVVNDEEYRAINPHGEAPEESEDEYEEESGSESIHEAQPNPTPEEEKPLNKQQREYLVLWETRYSQLKEYQKQHGTCNVDKKHDYVLNSWVRKQRGNWRLNKLSQIREERLTLLGFDFKGKRKASNCRAAFKGLSRDEQWELRFQQAVDFKRKHGHLRVRVIKRKERKEMDLPADTDLGLGPWLSTQNTKYRNNTLPKDKYDRLKELGYEFYDGEGKWEDGKRWEKRLLELKAYKEKFGDVDVPINYENKTLAFWVSTQRERYKKNKVSEDRVSRLRELGFTFDYIGRKKVWQQGFDKLVNYKEVFGHCNVPYRPLKTHPGLHHWAQSQRQKFKYGKLDKEYETKLRDLGFNFQMKERNMNKKASQAWNTRFSELLAFKELHNTANVPYNHTVNGTRTLANWVWTQRKKFREKSLLPHLWAKLNSIGFEFNPKYGSAKLSIQEQKIRGNNQPLKTWNSKKSQLNTKVTDQKDNVVKSQSQSKNNAISEDMPAHQKVAETSSEPVEKTANSINQFAIFDNPHQQQQEPQEKSLLFVEPVNLKPLNKQQKEYLVLWDTRYEELRKYKQQYGTCNVLKSHRVLNNWVKKQRAQFNCKKLSQIRYSRLTQLGFDFQGRPEVKGGKCNMKGVPSKEHWEIRFQQLVEFKRINGHVNVRVLKGETKQKLGVPPEKDCGLGAWLKRQFTMHRKKSLSNERYQKLLEIGCDFDSLEHDRIKRWDVRYQELVEFKNRFGHCNVSGKFAMPKLATWVSVQRQRWVLNKMPPDRIDRLSEIGFQFVAVDKDAMEKNKKSKRVKISNDKRWESQFQEMKSLKEQGCFYGLPKYSALSKWCSHQRYAFKKNKLSDERVSRLREIGVIRDENEGDKQTEEEWEASYQKFLVAKGPEKRQLKEWVGDQRSAFRRNVLSDEKVEKLRKIGFNFGKSNEAAKQNNPGEKASIGTKNGTESQEAENQNTLKKIKEKKRLETDDEWEDSFQKLMIKKGPDNLTRMKISKMKRGPLGSWISTQQHMNRDGTIPKKRFERLCSIGFFPDVNKLCFTEQGLMDHAEALAKKRKWKSMAPEWKLRYEELCQHFSDKGSFNFSPDESKKKGSIAAWAMYQRKMSTAGSISKSKFVLLCEAGLLKPKSLREYRKLYGTLPDTP